MTLPAKTRAVLDMANMTDCNPKRTPGVPHEELLPKTVPYANVCGAMLWISRMVRPDCMQRTAELALELYALMSFMVVWFFRFFLS